MNKPSSSTSLKLGRIQIDNLSFEEAVAQIIAIAREHGSKYVVTPNADHIVRLQTYPKFQAVYQGASLRSVIQYLKDVQFFVYRTWRGQYHD